MKLLLKYDILFFFMFVYLLSWIAWSLAYLLFPDSFLLQLPLMRIGAFAPALVSIFFCSLKNNRRSNNTNKRWITFFIVWIIASLHFYFYLYLIYIEGIEKGTLLIIITILISLLPAYVLSGIFSRKTIIREHPSTIFFLKESQFGMLLLF